MVDGMIAGGTGATAMGIAQVLGRLVVGLALATGSAGAQDLGDPMTLPPQRYTLDPAHASVIFRVSHLGFSMFTAGFDDVTASLDLDMNAPEAARLSVAIDPESLDLPADVGGFRDTMMGPEFFDVAAHGTMTFTSTRIARTGPTTADVTGDLTIRGVTRPVTLSVRFNGGYAHPPWEPVSRLGFSATGHLNRSEFGMDFGIPAAGSTIGVGDRVEVIVEAEFTGPKAP